MEHRKVSSAATVKTNYRRPYQKCLCYVKKSLNILNHYYQYQPRKSQLSYRRINLTVVVVKPVTFQLPHNAVTFRTRNKSSYISGVNSRSLSR